MDIKREYLLQQLREQTALASNWSDVKPIKNYYKPIRSCCESISRTNCCNCGARLKGWVCEYCGTVNN
ncbi:MAG: hypothetical protein J6Y78_16000 [Paludibacteraceae bacterium]|nr:hypothetical protein [Paludibacteraceae bacterium]